MNETLRVTAPTPSATIAVPAGRAARLLAVAAVACALTALALSIQYVLGGGNGSFLLTHQTLTPFITMAYAGIGALVATRQPRNPVGWIFLVVSLTAGVNSLSSVTVHTVTSGSPLFDIAESLNNWVWILQIVLPSLFIFLIFPDGRLLSPRWRPVAWAATAGLGGILAALALHPGPLPDWEISRNALGVRGIANFLNSVLSVSGWLLLIGFAGSVLSFALRYRASRGIERQQLKWPLFTFVLAVTASLFTIPLWTRYGARPLMQELGMVLPSVMVLAIGVSASVAILRYRLYDIDVVVNRTLVYGALTVCVLAIYVVVVGGLGTLLQAEGNPFLSIGATGLVAVVVQPLTNRLQRGVNRFFYGERDDPLGALLRLGKRLEAAITPEVVLPTLVDTIAQTLRLPYVAISLRSGEDFKITAQTGSGPADGIRLPLVYQGETVGELIAGRRGAGEPFSQADLDMLEQVAHQAGPTAYTVQLTEDLRQSRMRLVTAREEERRRLRRDLHDGLGPVLASQGLKMAAVSQLLPVQPEQAQRLLADLAAQNESTVAEIRRLVYELRPAALDDLGLAGAVSDYAADLKRGGDNGPRLQVDVRAPEGGLPPMAAAIEAAAYRIATEALTNISRHARAQHATVNFTLDGSGAAPWLQLEITDDGKGMAAKRRSGIGLISMRERAEEVGGRLQIDSAAGQGTRVMALLPLGAPQ